ncbi:MAG: M20/M25/M40 family metallo-hydrolase [Candidatus Geothermincolales bacterium]
MADKALVDYMYGLIERVMKEIGPRESCSEEERRLGRLFAQEIERACDRVSFEAFTCSPTAFMGFFPYLVALYLFGVVFYFFIPPIALAASLVAIAVFVLEVVRYKEFVDFLYPKREGENVVGVISPRKTPEKRVLVSAHLDSAYEFKIWYWFKGFSPILMGLAVFALLLLLGSSLARTATDPWGFPESRAFLGLGIALAAFTPVVAPFFFFHTSDVVPGAMDDMAGVAVLAGLARYLEESGKDGGFFPERTEVVLLALSSEEAGLRGAKRYAAAHAPELKDMPTYAIFLDGIYDQAFLTVFEKEIWPGGKMDPRLVDLAVNCAGKLGYPIRRGVLPLGATDASAFALAGIPSVCITLWDTTRLVPHYHTRLDTIERIKPESLGVALDLVVEMIREIDEEGWR